MKYLFQDEFDRIFENGIVPDGMSISWLMSQLDISDISRIIEQNYYSPNVHEYFHYPVDFMIKLVVVTFYRRIAFRHISVKLTEEDLDYLLPKNATYSLPSGSTLHHFIKYRLGEEGAELLMFSVGKKIAHFLQNKDLIIDSTPLEASRYSKNSSFNPHYEIKMDKAHILHMMNYPLYMSHSDGNENDLKYGQYLIDIAQLMDLHPDHVLMDKGYDSWEMHTRVFEKLDSQPVIQLRSTAIINKNATEEQIQKWTNKSWKVGGAKCRTMKEKLRFLVETRKRDIVGQYLRNQNIMNKEAVKEIYSKRNECERKHAHIKKIVKFDVKGYRKESKKLYSIMHFITFQLMNLAQLQNHFQNATSLAGYR